MAMDFTNVVKGQITQSLIKTLFERAGYRVTRLGVEELFVEVTQLDEKQYKALNLPLALRYLPDFLMADSTLNKAFLLEVKFRKDFNESTTQSLHYELTRQRVFWPDSYAVILIATSSAPGNHFHQDYIRIIPPQKTDLICPSAFQSAETHLSSWMQETSYAYVWNHLPTLNNTFDRFHASGETGVNTTYADIITPIIKDLQKL